MTVDTNQWKIASFKITEKLWGEFVTAAHQNGSTATEVLEALMAEYIAGEYLPTPKTAVDALAARLHPGLPTGVAAIPEPRAKSPESLPVSAGVMHAPEHSPNLTGIHVMILDDEVNIRTSITSILEHYGATVTAIDTPSIALKTLQTNPQTYDVLISDIGMPEQDGWSFIRQVRKLSAEAGGKIPAAALTSYASPREIGIARQLGFQVHITKPIDATLLASIVADLARK
jgi:CheY-like chemotaxis protein